MRGESALIRFEKKYIPEPNSGCWIWIGAINGRDERASFYFDGKVIYGHRASYLMFRGPIRDGEQVLHSCDLPSCVNPDHLWLGSIFDNMQDMEKKGRGVYPRLRGAQCSWKKLSDEQVAEIKTGVLSNIEYAEKFGIHKVYVSGIKSGKYYKDVIPPFTKAEKPQTEKMAARARYMREWYRKKRAR